MLCLSLPPSMPMAFPTIIVHATLDPQPGIPHPGSHQRYRHPRVVLGTRTFEDSPTPHALRIEMLYAGICGTDLHLVQSHPVTGYTCCSSPAMIPTSGRVLGHEGIGRVVAIGSSVDSLRWPLGTIVALEAIHICGKCDRCQSGNPNQCREARLLGLETDGLFSTFADVPANSAYDVTELIACDADLQALACLEPAAVAWVACQNARLRTGDRVTIFGGGPIGLLCAKLAREVFGAASVHLVEPLPFRREFGTRWVNQTSSPEQFAYQGDEEFDVLFEASGHIDQLDTAIPRLDAGGRIVLLGRNGTPLSIAGADHLITNALSITGSRGHLGGAFPALIELYRKGRFNPGDLVTRVVDGLDELAQILQAPARLAAQDCKVLVKFPAAANLF